MNLPYKIHVSTFRLVLLLGKRLKLYVQKQAISDRGFLRTMWRRVYKSARCTRIFRCWRASGANGNASPVQTMMNCVFITSDPSDLGELLAHKRRRNRDNNVVSPLITHNEINPISLQDRDASFAKTTQTRRRRAPIVDTLSHFICCVLSSTLLRS